MKKIRIAINGFGRIGRLALRQGINREDLEFVAINDLVDVKTLAYLLKYDSAQGKFPGTVVADAENGALVVNGKSIKVLSNRNLADNPWKAMDIDFVVESTGLFTSQEKAQGHLDAGAKRVVISAPAKGEMKTIVMGVNHNDFDPKADFIVSNASCTTNCLAPVAKVLMDNWGIEKGLMTTVHAATASQKPVDGPSSKMRSGRAVGVNIIPASTGAAKALGLVLPATKGKLTGMAFRVPTIDVSVVDLTVSLAKDATLEEINAKMKEAAEGPMKGILQYTDEPVVSMDFMGDAHSSTYDAEASIQLDSKFFKLIAWYDNEMGYATRVVDLIQFMASKI